MKIKTRDKQFIKWKDIRKYKHKYLNMLTFPRRQRCSICYIELIDMPFVSSMAGKPICEQCFIKAILETEQKLKERENGEV